MVVNNELTSSACAPKQRFNPPTPTHPSLKAHPNANTEISQLKCYKTIN